jgi:hypothetical protein
MPPAGGVCGIFIIGAVIKAAGLVLHIFKPPKNNYRIKDR